MNHNLKIDPEAVARIRAAGMSATSVLDEWFGVESPTTARRGKQSAITPEFRRALCLLLDTAAGHEAELAAATERAARENDVAFFENLTAAAQWIEDGGPTHSIYANHVACAKRCAAEIMAANGYKPGRKSEVKAAVTKELGQAAFDATSPEWSRIWAHIGIKNWKR